nr:hypothetical protein [Mucilaginibacter sp. L294]
MVLIVMIDGIADATTVLAATVAAVAINLRRLVVLMGGFMFYTLIL